MTSERTTLYKDKKNAKFMGVCAGIADYTGIDLNLVRLGFVISLCTPLSGITAPAYFLLGIFLQRKPEHLYVDRQEQQYWQRVRQSPARTAREVRAKFRDIDRRLADVEAFYVNSNPRLSAEIERLR